MSVDHHRDRTRPLVSGRTPIDTLAETAARLRRSPQHIAKIETYADAKLAAADRMTPERVVEQVVMADRMGLDDLAVDGELHVPTHNRYLDGPTPVGAARLDTRFQRTSVKISSGPASTWPTHRTLPTTSICDNSIGRERSHRL